VRVLLFALHDRRLDGKRGRAFALQVRALWLALLADADEVDWSLEDTKAKFSETTQQQVSDFAAHTAELWERFRTTGPGLPTVVSSETGDMDFLVYASLLRPSASPRFFRDILVFMDCCLQELSAGLEDLHKYEAALADALRQREALVLAEKLFNMPITAYPELAHLEADIRKLAQV
jgi:dynein heavy chain